jgi:hypothetical protein
LIITSLKFDTDKNRNNPGIIMGKWEMGISGEPENRRTGEPENRRTGEPEKERLGDGEKISLHL